MCSEVNVHGKMGSYSILKYACMGSLGGASLGGQGRRWAQHSTLGDGGGGGGGREAGFRQHDRSGGGWGATHWHCI